MSRRFFFLFFVQILWWISFCYAIDSSNTSKMSICIYICFCFELQTSHQNRMLIGRWRSSFVTGVFFPLNFFFLSLSFSQSSFHNTENAHTTRHKRMLIYFILPLWIWCSKALLITWFFPNEIPLFSASFHCCCCYFCCSEAHSFTKT